MAGQRFVQKEVEDEFEKQLPLLKAAGVRVVDSLSLFLVPEGSAKKNSVFIQYGDGKIPAPVTPSRARELRVR